MTKSCTKCEREFPLSSFAPRKDRNNKPHSWCDECRLKNIYRVRQNRKVKQDALWEYKREKGCVICGFNEPVALDFHHIDPAVKDKDIAQMLALNSSMEKILEEVSKCIVLCSNHHRMYHAGLIELC